MIARAAIRVQPRARANRVEGQVGGYWKICVTAPAVEGKANRACVDFLSRALRVPGSRVRIVSGETSRHKRIEIEGVEQEVLERFLRGEGG